MVTVVAVPPWESIEDDLRARLARNVRRIRKSRGLSLEAMVDDGDALSWRQVQRIEAEEHSATLRTLAKLAYLLDVDPLDLLR